MTRNYEIVWPLLIIGTVFLVSGQSEIAAPGFSFNIDKIVHFGVFGALATSLVRLDFFQIQGWRGAVQVCVLVSIYGGLDEWWQSFTPERVTEFADWVADTAGTVVAVGLYQGWERYRKLLERRVLLSGAKWKRCE
jgi:VanZ family protein